MPFFTESWFYRGVQSALFYYVSLAPCLEYKHKRKRRRDATRAQKEREEIITTQPGVVRQPAPFQTNEDWAEEIVAGPGPPKGWKKDKAYQKLSKRVETHPSTAIHLDRLTTPNEERPATALTSAAASSPPASPTTSSKTHELQHHKTNVTDESTTNDYQNHDLAEHDRLSSPVTRSSENDSAQHEAATSTVVSRFSTSSRSNNGIVSAPQRPSMDRRLSTAMDNIKDTIRTTLHPDRWNWIRYDREDEILSGFNERVSRMWDKVTGITGGGKDEPEDRVWHGRKRAETNDSERAVWARGRNPAINDLHPPIVSQLPATREEAGWMLLPPPSADVMAGKVRPGAEAGMRWPLAIIGRDHVENSAIQGVEDVDRTLQRSPRSSVGTSRTPDLSTTSEETWSDEWDGEDREEQETRNTGESQRRQSAPISGWTPKIQTPAQSYFVQQHRDGLEELVPPVDTL